MNDELTTDHPGLVDWIRYGERGLSSEAIVDHLAHHPIARANGASCHPHDPADLRRCVLLLDAVPTLRPLMPSMADVSAEWAALVDHWDELEATFRREMSSGSYYATDTYTLMKSVLDGAVRKEDS